MLTETASVSLAHRHLPGTTLVEVGGELDLATGGRLARYVTRVRRPGDHLVLDLAGLSFLDCSGLRVLVAAARAAADDGAGLRLARVGGTPGRLLGLVRLHTLLPVYDTVEQALAAVRPARPLSPSFPRWRS